MAEEARIDKLFGAFDRLTPREKGLVGGLAAGVLLAAIALVWMLVGQQMTALEERNQSLSDTLARIQAGKEKYLQEKVRLDADKKRLETNELKLVKLMEDQAAAQGITIEDFKEAKRFLTENARKRKKNDKGEVTGPPVKDLVEESQTVTLHNLSVDQLSKFMASLEGRQEPVKVTRISVQTQFSDRSKLREVRMTVATYRMEEGE